MPRTTHPRAITSGLAAGQTAEAKDVLDAIIPLDKAIEDLRTGWLEFGQLRFDPTASTLTVTAGAITVTNSYHAITSAALQVLSTINGANQGDIIYLVRSGGADIIVGDYLLGANQGVWIVKEAVGFSVLASNGSLLRHAFRATRITSVQAIAASTNTKVQYNGVDYQQTTPLGANVYDPTTNYRYTPGRVGVYDFDILVTYSSAMDAGGLVVVTLAKNGSVIAQTNEFGTGVADLTIPLSHQDLATSASNYYEVFTYHFNAGSRNIYASATQCYFTGVRVGELN
ncbi:MAG: hypothetical protein K8L91_07990 [Anaerolineae bacterium]|nr:hypothetical protein [Anaerolineae bacterium]